MMIRDWFTKNIGLKLASLVIGIIMWVLVVNALDPVTSFTVYNVPVVLENTEAITGQNKVFNVISGGTVSLTVQAKKTNQPKISQADFLATADMSMAYGSNPERRGIIINVKVVNNADIIESWSVRSDNVLQFAEEDIIERAYVVEIEASGELPDIYRLSALGADPMSVVVRGPESVMGSVSRVVVRPNISELTPDNPEVEAVPLILNSNGAVINNSALSMGVESVSVYASLYHTKTVAVTTGGVSGRAADGYRYSGSQVDVQSVVVQGSRSDLANISSIIIPATVLDITGAVNDMIFPVDLREYLPEGVTIAEGSSPTANVQIFVEKLENKSFQIPSSQVEIRGRDEDMIYSIVQTNVTVTISGLKTDLDVLTADSLGLAVYVEDLGPGYYTLPAEVSVSSGYSVNGPVNVGIRITMPETEPPTETVTEPSADTESQQETPDTETVPTTGEQVTEEETEDTEPQSSEEEETTEPPAPVEEPEQSLEPESETTDTPDV